MKLREFLQSMIRRPANAQQRADRTLLQRTAIIMLALGVIVFIPLLGNLYHLMIVQNDYYSEKAINNQTVSTKLTADRGTIYDRNMNILATSSTVENVFMDPGLLQEREEDLEVIVSGLSELLDLEPEWIREQAAKTQLHYVVLKRKLEQADADAVRSFLNEHAITSVSLEPDSKRYYPYTTLAAQVIGFTNADNVGAEGLESYYDSTLQGTAGKVITTEGNHGTQMLYSYTKYYEATDGDSIVTTIDSTVQYYLEKNMKTAIENYDVQNGAFGIVMNCKTGEILAMANFDEYDPNQYLEIYNEVDAGLLEEMYQQAMGLRVGSTEREEALTAYNEAMAAARLSQWRNRCVSDGYEPGSTFKLITLSAALDSGAVTLNDTFYCGGTAKFEGRTEELECWYHNGHGQETTAQALQNSCNIAFANIGLKVGGETFYQYVKNFGLLNTTGVDLPGEGAGYFYTEGQLTDPMQQGTSNLISVSFGQTSKVTPLQLVRAVSAIVNGGYLMRPYVVSEVVDAAGNTVSQTEPTVIRQVISEETSATMRELMESVVTEGTAKNAKVAGYSIGGKTGTSEKVDVLDENGEMVEDKMVSFIGVAPMEDPQYVCLVVLDTPSRETGLYISGGVMAAPTVGAVFEDILPYLGVEPDYSDDDISRVAVTVPDLTGMTASAAGAELQKSSLEYRTVGSGDTVTGQIPAGGTQIPGKSTVILYMGEQAPTELVEVPALTGLTPMQVNEALTNAGLYLMSRGTTSQAGTVFANSQDIEPGTMVPRGSMVTVTFADSTARD